MDELQQRVEKLERELPPLKCIKMRHSMTRARDGWCRHPREVTEIQEFAEMCKPLVDWLQKHYEVAQAIIITPEDATLYAGEISVPFDWDYVTP